MPARFPPDVSSVRSGQVSTAHGHRLRPLLLCLCALSGLSACQPDSQSVSTPSTPPSVVAETVTMQEIRPEVRFVGHVVAVNHVDLRARVDGFLKERRFTEGQAVAKDDVLFVIEPDQYQARVAQAQADVAKAKADAENADAQLQRGLELLAQKNIAQAKVDELTAAAAVAKAGIAQAEAALQIAELNLSYTQITAPVAGRIGLATFTVGNLVGPSSGVLATIVSRDPIHVQFPVTQRQLLQAKQNIAAQGGDPADIQVQVRLPDDSLYDHTGHLDFVNVTTEQGTDTVTLRAEFPNPDGILVDGQYVKVIAQSGQAKKTVLVPQSALQMDQQGTYAMIVDPEKKAQIRRVEMGSSSQGGKVAIAKGLAAGDLLIVQGMQKVRPGQEVQMTPAAAVPEAGQ